MTTRVLGRTPKETGPFKLIRNVAVAFFGIILLVVLLLSEPVDYACKQPYTADRQWLFFAIGLAVVAVTFAIAFLLRGRCASVRELLAKKSTFTLLISLCSIVLLFVQCFIARSTWFETDYLPIFPSTLTKHFCMVCFASSPKQDHCLGSNLAISALYSVGAFL